MRETDPIHNMQMGSDPLLLANKSTSDNEGDINGVPTHNNSIIKDLQGDLLRSYELHNPLARCIGFTFFPDQRNSIHSPSLLQGC